MKTLTQTEQATGEYYVNAAFVGSQDCDGTSLPWAVRDSKGEAVAWAYTFEAAYLIAKALNA